MPQLQPFDSRTRRGASSPPLRKNYLRPTDDSYLQKIDTRELTALMPYLHRFACCLTRNPDQAADLVQETVERALRKAHLFDGSNLRAWLTTICRRIFLNTIRRNKSQGVVVDIDDAPTGAVSVEAQQDIHIHFRDVAAAFEKLTETDRRVISLSAVDGLKYSEIAEVMEVPIGTVRSRLSRARLRLVDLVECGPSGSASERRERLPLSQRGPPAMPMHPAGATRHGIERRAKNWNPVSRLAGANKTESTLSGHADLSPDAVVGGMAIATKPRCAKTRTTPKTTAIRLHGETGVFSQL
jgi:RNA polymerase sigma-70 factor (ECF subfamily)